MSKVLAVFGATGTQGGSVISNVLKDPKLSNEYKIRAITRDVNSEKAQQLKEKVEVVQGDVTDSASLERALAGAHTVFGMTTPHFGPDPVEVEFNHGKTIADISVGTGAQYIIFSTLPSPSEMSGGKYAAVAPFDSKAKIEQYIRTLPIKSAFFAGGFFMENFFTQPFLNPRPAPDGTFVLARHVSSKTELPYIAAANDTGKFVGAILAEPEKYQGKTFCAAQALYTFEDIAATLSKATGKTVVYKQIPEQEFKDTLGVPFMADLFAQGFSCQEEHGYFGLGTKRNVAWAAEQARGRLTSLEEFFQENPLQLA